MHDIARYIDAQINLSTYEWGTVTQDEPIVRGDCNVLRIALDGEPPENALIYVRFINLLTHDSYSEISRTLTDGMEIDIPQNKELFSSPGQIGVVFSIETETCKKSCSRPIKISIIPLCCGNEYVGETGVALIGDVYAAGEAAEAAAENANTAATELRQAAANGDFDGQDGAPGQPGADGFSPTVSVTQTETGARISATDKDGTTTADISNGAPGQPGEDGFSPIIAVTDIEGGHRVTITDAQGTQYFDVLDGEGGGGSVVSPTITVQNITGGHRLIITDIDGTKTVDVMDGAKGDTGATYTPSVSSAGVISWTNNGGLPNPPPVDIKGADGEDGYSPTATVTKSGDTATITITDKNGTTTAQVSDGQDGAPGATPVKGVDYFTDAEIADIVSEAAAEVDALPSDTKYAGAYAQGGAAKKALGIPFGKVDSTSTATAFTATIEGVTELYHGLKIMLTNGVVTSASGCTLNINGLGAKRIYNTLTASTAITTAFNINYTMEFTYNTERVSGGCWDMYYGMDANTTYTNASLGQGYGTCTTAEATVAKTATLSSYSATTNGIVAIRFTNAVPANATLNINSKGAKAIQYRGAAITAGIIKAGDIATFIYNGTHYLLLAVDRTADTSEIVQEVLDALPTWTGGSY